MISWPPFLCQSHFFPPRKHPGFPYDARWRCCRCILFWSGFPFQRVMIQKSSDQHGKDVQKSLSIQFQNHINAMNYRSTGAGIKLLIQNKITICNNAMNYLSTLWCRTFIHQQCVLNKLQYSVLHLGKTLILSPCNRTPWFYHSQDTTWLDQFSILTIAGWIGRLYVELRCKKFVCIDL